MRFRELLTIAAAATLLPAAARADCHLGRCKERVEGFATAWNAATSVTAPVPKASPAPPPLWNQFHNGGRMVSPSNGSLVQGQGNIRQLLKGPLKNSEYSISSDPPPDVRDLPGDKFVMATWHGVVKVGATTIRHQAHALFVRFSGNWYFDTVVFAPDPAQDSMKDSK